jgi:uncharacterized protein with PhoU and TrkA domain
MDLCNFELSQQAMSTYAYKIVQIVIIDIEPDEHVKRAMNEINAGNFFKTMICLKKVNTLLL